MIEVRHGNRICRVHFASIGEVLASLADDVRIVTDQNVRAALGSHLGRFEFVHTVTPGESSKSLEVYGGLVRWCAEVGTKRSGTIVALGGGVVGDLAGFAAASYMRGIRLIQIPTSLLAQVDSSVGGKVGIDLPEGKNLVGAFYAADDVWVCADALATLPDREFRAGCAEVWKYGYIMDVPLLDELLQSPLTPDSPILASVVERCIRDKAAVVEQDEHETTGLRAILNFGHTVAHALERLSGYQDLLHGEAVAIGMVVEGRVAELLGVAEPGLSRGIAESMRAQGLPNAMPRHLAPADVAAAARLDKKATGTGLAFSLVPSPGECKLITGIEESVLMAAMLDCG